MIAADTFDDMVLWLGRLQQQLQPTEHLTGPLRAAVVSHLIHYYKVDFNEACLVIDGFFRGLYNEEAKRG